jgi:hypothetical protein
MRSRSPRRTTRARRRSRKPFFNGKGGETGGTKPFFQAAFPIQSKPEESSGQRVDHQERGGKIRRQGNAEVPVAGPTTARQIAAAKGKGQALPKDVSRRMEQGLGADFSSVRVHTDTQAIHLSRRLRAQAFTHGADVFFNAGRYRPYTREGAHLLAHELVHTRQQGASSPRVGREAAGLQRKGGEAESQPAELPQLDRQSWKSRVKAARQLKKGSEKAEKEKQYRELIAEALQSMPAPAGVPWSSPAATDIQIDFQLDSHAITYGKRVEQYPQSPWKWIEFGTDALLNTPEWTRNTARHEFVHVKQYLAIWEQYQQTPEDKRGSWEAFMKPFNVKGRVLGPEEMEAHLTTFSVLDQLQGTEVRQSLEGLYQSYFYTAAYQVPPGSTTPISFSEAASQFVAGYQASSSKVDIEFYLVSALMRHSDTFDKSVFLRALQGIAPIVKGAKGNDRAMKFLPEVLSLLGLTLEEVLGTEKKKK